MLKLTTKNTTTLVNFHELTDLIANVAKSAKSLTVAVLAITLLLQQVAQANPQFVSMHSPRQQNNHLTVTQYELALVQVLAEICPPMLSHNQRIKFTHAYQNQLRSFIPTSANPSDTLKQLHKQRDYRSALQSVRAWTASYPKTQNRELCLQFTEIEF